MSQQPSEGSKSKTPTIKIAASNPDQRGASGGGVDPGPGDPNAAPSSAPMSVDIPEPPTSSQLVVKSTSATKSPSVGSAQPSALGTMYQNTRSGTSKSQGGGGSGSGAASQASGGVPKEPTSSRALTGPERSKSGAAARGQQSPLGGSPSTLKTASSAVAGSSGHHSKSHHSVSGSHHSGASHSKLPSGSGGGASGVSGADGASGGGAGAGGPEPSASPADDETQQQANTASTAMKADSVHQEDEEGEGEIGEATPSPTDGATGGPEGASGVKSGAGSSQAQSPDMSAVPASSGAGVSKMSTKTGGRRSAASASDFPSTSTGAAASGASGASSSSMKDKSLRSGASSSSAFKTGKDGKKVTKFRYHKRITVRTHGKTSPSTILAKVNQKDHKAGITASTIDDMDPKEIMRRAGIPENKKAHWRVRLRQTKRLTKNGKTATQTKVIYRDSEGNKQVKRSTDPYCKKCGKKLEDCKCKS